MLQSSYCKLFVAIDLHFATGIISKVVSLDLEV